MVDSNVMLTGDEDGGIKMWDMRRFVTYELNKSSTGGKLLIIVSSIN